MADPTSRLTLGELARQALAAPAGTRAPLVAQLARGTRTVEHVVAVAELLFAGGKHGPAIALEWLVRVSPRVPMELSDRFVPLLADEAIPAHLRTAAAARLLRDRPDNSPSVRPVAKSLTRGLSPLRGLERLRQLQHLLDRSRALDQFIERREHRVKIDCPRCRTRLPRVLMVKHLWFVHGAFLHEGKVLDSLRMIALQKSAFARSGDAAAIDRAVLLAGNEASAMLREWLAETPMPAEDTAPLRREAEDHRCGLCPRCLAEIPEPIKPLPAPLAITADRVAGDGHAVQVGGAAWFRFLRVETPERVLKSGPDRLARMISPRGVAVLLAALVLLGTAAAALVMPREVAPPVVIAGLGLAAAIIVYTATRLIRRPLQSAEDRAIDAAWTILGRRFVQREGGTRFLIRLCRVSLGRGDPVERVGVLNRIIERAERTASESNSALQLLAAARVLLVEDAGRDRLAGIASLAAEAFRGDRSIVFAEHVVGCFIPRDSGESTRMKLLLIAAAFDGGLRPKDLIDLWAVAPNLRQAMSIEPLHRLGLLYGLWVQRTTRRWERIGVADSVFDLAKHSAGGRLLKPFPDLLLTHTLDPDTDADLGPVLVCGRGVSVGGVMIVNPDTEMSIGKGPRGGYELHLGRRRVKLERRPPDRLIDILRGWLQVRATMLLPFIDGYLDPSPADVTQRVLSPFRRHCGRCGTVSTVAVGTIGPAIEGRR